MTLNRVQVSSVGIFATAQLYVALSRATTLEGLELTGGSRKQVKIDIEILKLYRVTKWEGDSAAPDASTKVVDLTLDDEDEKENFSTTYAGSSEHITTEHRARIGGLTQNPLPFNKPNINKLLLG